MHKQPAKHVMPRPETTPERHYANHLRVGFNYSEFLLDFAQDYDGQTQPLVHTRLVISPAHMKAVIELLRACLDDYEQKFGDIKAPIEH